MLHHTSFETFGLQESLIFNSTVKACNNTPSPEKRILFSSNIKVLLLYMTCALYKLQTDYMKIQLAIYSATKIAILEEDFHYVRTCRQVL